MALSAGPVLGRDTETQLRRLPFSKRAAVKSPSHQAAPMALSRRFRAAAALGSKRMAPATRRIRHMRRLCAVGHHHLHSEMQLPADRALTEQFAGSDHWRIENKLSNTFRRLRLAAAASIMRSHSGSVVAIGFCTLTCEPAASAATVIVSCCGCGVRISIRSRSKPRIFWKPRVTRGRRGARPPGERERRVGVAQRRNLHLGMIEVAAHIKIEYAPNTDKANA
jgi:hypothetical protein